MNILIITDFDLRGSGYKTIATGIGNEMAERGHAVAVLGMDYTGGEHPGMFSVVATDPTLVSSQANKIISEWEPSAVIVIFDLTTHERAIELSGADRPVYIGIFAVEGGPMINPSPWAAAIKRMDLAYPISRFGAEACREALLDCKEIPFGIDTGVWKPLSKESRERQRKMLGIEDKFIVLTVADNQERKNLPCAIEAIAKVKEEFPDIYYILVTKERPHTIGWNLYHEVKKNGIERNTYIHEKGCDDGKLRDFYGISDAFLITSKAEGLCVPLIEAMACGLPCVASETCSIPYILDGRGLLIKPEYEITDPFGNTRRQLVSSSHAASQLLKLIKNKKLYNRLQKASLEYVKDLSWDKTVDILEGDLNAEIEKKEEGRKNAKAPTVKSA